MSASREKKIRQDLAAQGVTDPKEDPRGGGEGQGTQEQYPVRRDRRRVRDRAAVLLVYNSGVLQRSATAVTINGEKYTAGQVEYFYANVKNSLLKSSYASFYGIDTSTIPG